MYSVASDANASAELSAWEKAMATEEKLKEDELKEIIRKKRGGRWIEYHGPYRIGTADVWEIWTWINENKEDKDDWTRQTRFWLEEKNGRNFISAIFQT